MNLPSQIQLATIAATLTGSHHDRAQAALAVWKACGQALEREAEAQARIDARTAENESLASQFPSGDTVTLESFLKATMPRSKPEDRMKKFRDFLRVNIPATREMNREYGFPDGEKLTDKQLDMKVVEVIARLRGEGYSRQGAISHSQTFLRYIERATAEARSERGKKGALAKKSLGAKKTARKSPQVKRSNR